MFFFTPRYLKHAKLLHKGVTRFINYKRDVLPQAKLDEITTLRTNLEDAMRAKDKARISALNDEINKACEKALPHVEHSDIGENVEVFFVAIVIALGIRSYIAQPFKIPTGSMQPTLYGLVAENTAEDPTPNVLKRCKDWVTGRSYFNVVANHTGWLKPWPDALTEHSFMGFFTHCRLHFADGQTQWIWAPMRQLLTDREFSLGMERYLKVPVTEKGGEITPDAQAERRASGAGSTFVTEGQLLARGTLDTGDHVLVNKFSYHFRRPVRGEVFVFTTKNISAIGVPEEQGSQHYIKRLAGVPGDELSVESPLLKINGKLAEEPGFKRVMSGTEEHPKDGYKGYAPAARVWGNYDHILLRDHQYFALGDNSYNSSDGRKWGTVPERNLVGPALFCYFPLGRNWGLIR
ncbi:signal peptidase I [Prosthecobacter sp.]|uniref:signal peptidase I n=1 Tax=Prosthecobacter sp. TaxID=1965333 RepID=UPI001DC4E7BF|nr:signal peptidase I [Prosthecobacter sp.]MCB1276864.1 signal peptidase I [Prosthecobacter sp.]